ncbi:MAG: DNA recombination protein RmuC [Nitrososphaerales archaeon]|jgi:DNA anti-recombination protein RmuC
MAYDYITIPALIVIIAIMLVSLSRLRQMKTEMVTQAELQRQIAPLQSMNMIAQNLGSQVSSLQSSVAEFQSNVGDLQSKIGDVKTQAERISAIAQKYDEAERLTRDIHSVLVGSYSKGSGGEEILGRMMTELMKRGIVESQVTFGTKVVEYAVRFPDGRLMAIDSKVVDSEKLARMNADGTSDEERENLARDVVNGMRKQIEKVAAYKDPNRTLPYAIMAIPDSLLEHSPELVGEASRQNVIIASYSSLPPLIEYFVKVQTYYSVQQDVTALGKNLDGAAKELARFDDNYFANKFDRPLGTITRATSEVSKGVREARLYLEYKATQSEIPLPDTEPE